jgi:hypothetical protein
MRVIAFVLLCVGAQITWNGVEALLKRYWNRNDENRENLQQRAIPVAEHSSEHLVPMGPPERGSSSD